jgi:hypothetical protein
MFTPAKMLIMMGFKPINMLVYTPSTWAEWEKPAGVVGDSTGLEWTSNSSAWQECKLPTNIKTSTKYGFLYSVVSTTFATDLTSDVSFAFPTTPFPTTTTGNKKVVMTSKATITTNKLTIRKSLLAETSGNKVKIKDLRLFELPTGSQIESDFTNLTADQLTAIYPY